jgi:hypothetical protein
MRLSACLALLFWISIVDAAGADEIFLTNGDRLTGKLISLVGGKLSFQSDMAGKLKIDRQNLATFSTVDAIEIHAADGTVVHDIARTAGEGTFRVEGEGTVGPQTLQLSETVAINPEPPRFKGKILAAAKIERGNSFTEEATVEADAVRESDVNRITLKGTYRGDRERDESTGTSSTTDRLIRGTLKYDHFISKRLYWLASTFAEKDGVADLDLRLIGTGGLGYHWIREEDLEFLTEVGLSWTSEDYRDSSRDDDFVAAMFRWELKKRLADNVSFFHDGKWAPSLEEDDVQLMWTETGIQTDLTTRLFLEAKVVWEWDSEPSSGKERQDVDYIFGLGFRF